jgi:hypothetical protein
VEITSIISRTGEQAAAVAANMAPSIPAPNWKTHWRAMMWMR